MKRLSSAALLCLCLLTAAGVTGCDATRKARAEREMREFWGDGYDKAKAEMDAAEYARWVLSWEDGPPVTLHDPAQFRISTQP